MTGIVKSFIKMKMEKRRKLVNSVAWHTSFIFTSFAFAHCQQVKCHKQNDDASYAKEIYHSTECHLMSRLNHIIKYDSFAWQCTKGIIPKLVVLSQLAPVKAFIGRKKQGNPQRPTLLIQFGVCTSFVVIHTNLYMPG